MDSIDGCEGEEGEGEGEGEEDKDLPPFLSAMALKQAKSTKTTAVAMSKTKATMQSIKPHCTSKKQIDSSDPWSFLV